MPRKKTDQEDPDAWERSPGYCPRLAGWQPMKRHEACPYCFGDRRAIQMGDRRCFCDFQKGVDPVHFGFPETHGRHLQG